MRKQQFSLAGLRFKEGYDDHNCKRSARGTAWKINLTLAAGNNVGMDDAEILFASTTYACLVRSEGGRICCNFSNLSELGNR